MRQINPPAALNDRSRSARPVLARVYESPEIGEDHLPLIRQALKAKSELVRKIGADYNVTFHIHQGNFNWNSKCQQGLSGVPSGTPWLSR